jgi:hypothetical protein
MAGRHELPAIIAGVLSVTVLLVVGSYSSVTR